MLKQGNCVKRLYGATTLTLTAETGNSLLVRRIYVEPHSSETLMLIRVERKTVGVYRIGGKGGNQLGHIRGKDYPLNLMEYLEGQGINCSIPIAEGQSMVITVASDETEVIVVFDRYTETDILARTYNGTESKEYMFMQYVASSATLSASGDLLIDTSLSPAEFPDFPCGKNVPAKHTIDIVGVVGNPVAIGVSGSNQLITTFLKMIKERETLFDEDRAGIVFRGQRSGGASPSYQTAMSLIGACHDGTNENTFASKGYPLLFKPALRFTAGDELLVYVTGELTGSVSLAGSLLDLGFIMKVKVD